MLIIEDGKNEGCKLVLDTPYYHIETDEYMVFTKFKGCENIEINNLTLDEIKLFQSLLDKLIKENEEEIVGE